MQMPRTWSLRQVEFGNASTPLTNTAFSPLTLIGATDTVVEPGFVGLGDTPHEVVFRFAEPLPQDIYQIEMFGSGPLALRNVDGEAFSDGEDFGVQFSLNNAPQVAAVVPTPVRRQADGSLAPELNIVEVYFNEEMGNATDPSFYELLYTRDTVSNLDDFPVRPTVGELRFGDPRCPFDVRHRAVASAGSRRSHAVLGRSDPPAVGADRVDTRCPCTDHRVGPSLGIRSPKRSHWAGAC